MPKPKTKYWLYIIECRNGTYYTGTTSNLEERWKAHTDGSGSNYTRKHPPKKLVFVKEFRSIYEARERELQVRKWSQEKKNKLISGEWE